MAKRDYIESTGNVFADLGFPDADETLAKAELSIKIAVILRWRSLAQAQAAAILGVDQPKVAALIRGRLSGFSIEWLLCFLLPLGNVSFQSELPAGREVQMSMICRGGQFRLDRLK